MEGLRGFAVFLVFLVHYVTLVQPYIAGHSALVALSGALHTIGNTGVDLFFVLSGYLIYGSLIAKPQPFGRFMVRRVQRIYPAFAVVFLTYIALSYVYPAQNKIPTSARDGAIFLIENALLLPGMFPIEPLITVAWSLSYEMAYYFVIPLLITMVAMRRRSMTWRVSFFAVMGLAMLVLGAAYGGHIRLAMFVSGILLYEAIKSGRITAPSNGAALVALVAGLLAMLLPIAGSAAFALKIAILFVSFFLVCFCCFVDPHGWLARAFSWTPVRWLGNMSYSYYLLHGLALNVSFTVLAVILSREHHGPLYFWGLLPVMFALSLVPPAVLFLLIERPFSLAPAVPRPSGQTAATVSNAAVAAGQRALPGDERVAAVAAEPSALTSERAEAVRSIRSVDTAG